MRNKIATGIASILLLLFVHTGARAQSAVEAGKKIFESTCANGYCHSPDGGGAGPTNLQDRRFTAGEVTQIISDGVAGTGMPAWKTKFDADQIAKLAAFVLSLSPNGAGLPDATLAAKPAQANPAQAKPAAGAAKAADSYLPAVEAQIGGNAAQGRSIFFDDADPANCGVCHTFQGKGGRVGPDLTNIGSKATDEILRKIVQPGATVDQKYAAMSITTRDGKQYTGIKRDETKELVRIYDASSLPPVLRTFLKADIAKTEALKSSVMPSNYGEKYSQKDLLDLVTYLKAGGPNPNLMFSHSR